MKRILTIAICGIAVFVLAAGSSAQVKPGKINTGGVPVADKARGGMLNKLTQMLALTRDQVAKIKAILKNERQQIKALRGNGNPKLGRPVPIDLKAKIRAIRQNTYREIRSVLNPDQQLKFDAWLKSRRK